MRNKIFFLLALALLAFPATAKVDINNANAKELADSLKWIGEKKAMAIIDYREKNGVFCSVDDLKMVRGVGNRDVEENRHLLTVKSGDKSLKNCGNVSATDAR